MELGDGLLVQDVRVGEAVNTLYSRDSRQIGEFVHRGRIESERALAELAGEFPRKHASELRRMLGTVHTGRRIVGKPLVDLDESARLGTDSAATPGESVDGFGRRMDHSFWRSAFWRICRI